MTHPTSHQCFANEIPENDNLGFYPYHIQRIQNLEPADMARPLEVCGWVAIHSHLGCYILFTDEAHETKIPEIPMQIT
jgi:hypothetical protein